jgi:hypothetical protein
VQVPIFAKGDTPKAIIDADALSEVDNGTSLPGVVASASALEPVGRGASTVNATPEF